MTTSRRQFLHYILLAALLFTSFGQAAANSKNKFLVYVGTYTDKNSRGIYAYRFDASTGELTPLGLAGASTNPSFLAVSRDRKFLYAVDEVPNYHGPNSGAIRAFAVNRATGKLTLLNEVASRGADPCYLSLDKKGKYVLTANYTGGNVASFPILRDGRLRNSPWLVQHSGIGFNPERQEGPHAHSINVSPDNHFAIATDLGLDQIITYRFKEKTGSLSPTDQRILKVDAGAGPRHFTFHPNGKFAYVVNELQSTVLALRYDHSGSLHVLQKISMLPPDFKDRNDAAEVQVHPSGKFLYASNRGHDSIAVFSIDKEKGTLTRLEVVSTRGKEPRHFGIDPTGAYLLAANQNSDNIVVFRIDEKTGRLTPTGQVLETPTPVYVKFVPLD
jgi:6-phosphogluconolactonase